MLAFAQFSLKTKTIVGRCAAVLALISWICFFELYIYMDYTRPHKIDVALGRIYSLGHSGLQTTMRYARADLDLKRQALAQVFPDVLGAPKAGRMALHGTELTRWLRRL